MQLGIERRRQSHFMIDELRLVDTKANHLRKRNIDAGFTNILI